MKSILPVISSEECLISACEMHTETRLCTPMGLGLRGHYNISGSEGGVGAG